MNNFPLYSLNIYKFPPVDESPGGVSVSVPILAAAGGGGLLFFIVIIVIVAVCCKRFFLFLDTLNIMIIIIIKHCLYSALWITDPSVRFTKE